MFESLIQTTWVLFCARCSKARTHYLVSKRLVGTRQVTTVRCEKCNLTRDV